MREFWAEVADLLGAGRYSQHSICLTNDSLMLILYTAAGLVIWVSYLTIGFSLLHRRHLSMTLNLPARVLFGSFIIACGWSHFLDVLTLFTGVYRLDIAVKALAASVSGVCAVFVVSETWGQTHNVD